MIKSIKDTYSALRKHVVTRKSMQHIKVPQLISKNGSSCKYTLQGLMFVFFGLRINKIIKKNELVTFLKRYNCKSHDPQPRHFGMQYGFDFLVMGSYHAKTHRILKAGEYCMRSLSTPHPNACFTNHRSKATDMSTHIWRQMVKKYNNRCACCGSPEGQDNYRNKNVLTVLEKGHKDPRKPLNASNCLPICSVCNRAYKNKCVFMANGFVKPII